MRMTSFLLTFVFIFHAQTGWGAGFEVEGKEAAARAPVYRGAEEESILNIDPQAIKEELRDKGKLLDPTRGTTQSLIYLLFAIAVLIEMTRITHTDPDWAGLFVRVVMILAVLLQYRALFEGVERVSESLAHTILGGSAFENLMDSQIAAAKKISENFRDQNFGITSLFKPLSLVMMFGYTAYVFGIAMHYLYSFGYHVITTALYFVGPIIISLSLVSELNFVRGFISSLMTVCSWNLISALLVKIMSLIFVVSVDTDINFKNMILLIVFNVAYGLSTLMVPLFSLIIFSGKNFGTVGVIAGAAFLRYATKGTGAIMDGVGMKSHAGREGSPSRYGTSPESHAHGATRPFSLESRRVNYLTEGS